MVNMLNSKILKGKWNHHLWFMHIDFESNLEPEDNRKQNLLLGVLAIN